MPPKLNFITVKRKLTSLKKKLDPAAFEQMVAEKEEVLKRSEENLRKFIVNEEKEINRIWTAQISTFGQSTGTMTIRELKASGGSFTPNPSTCVYTITNVTGYQATPNKQDSKLLARKQAQATILMSQKRSNRQSKRVREVVTSTPNVPAAKKIDNTASVDKPNKFRISLVNPKTPKGGRILPKEPRKPQENEAIVTLKCSVSGTPLLTRDIIESEDEPEEFEFQ